MILRHTRSFSTKLTLMNMLASGAALLLACLAFFAYDQITFRQGLLRTLSAQAQIIASNSVSALLFNDPQAANSTLSALRNSPNIAAAAILTVQRHPFGWYNREGGDEILNAPTLPDNQIEGHWLKSTHAVLIRKVLSEGKPIGFVYIRADLGEIDERLWRYTFISVGVLLVSLMFALLASSQFRKSVAEPIIALAETARKISRDKDYRVRVPESGERDDELGTLMNSFNEMLKEIQQRDSALQKAHDELEQRVSDRTSELVSANRELEAFSYSVSHDLRAPLRSIDGFSQALLEDYADKLDIHGRDTLQRVRAATQKMSVLIDDLINLARVSRSEMHKEEFNLSAVSKSIGEQLQTNEPARHGEFVIEDELRVNGDPRLLRVALENLLGNAWKYTSRHDHAQIKFGAYEFHGQPVYFVRDNGAGFDPQYASKLFEAFQRLHSAAEFPGTGIGLATVQRIVRRHGGEIWAESAVEKGATFYFTLSPISSSAQKPPRLNNSLVGVSS